MTNWAGQPARSESTTDRAAAPGYTLSQAELLDPILAARDRDRRQPAQSGAYRTYLVPVRDTLDLTGLTSTCQGPSTGDTGTVVMANVAG